MEYNFYEIGKRIIEERKKNGLKNQDALIERLSDIGIKVGRNKISAIENGTATKETFSLALLTGLCQIFDCEIGYLLCEPGYENKTRVKTDICKETGLTEEAVNILTDSRKDDIEKIYSPDIAEAISLLLEKSTIVQDIAAYLEESSLVSRNYDVLNFRTLDYGSMTEVHCKDKQTIQDSLTNFLNTNSMSEKSADLLNFIRSRHNTEQAMRWKVEKDYYLLGTENCNILFDILYNPLPEDERKRIKHRTSDNFIIEGTSLDDLL